MVELKKRIYSWNKETIIQEIRPRKEIESAYTLKNIT